LRFDAAASAAPTAIPAGQTPLRIEGNLRPPADGESWEYSVVVSIRNHRGEEVARKLIGVGAMGPDEHRSFTLSVEMTPARAKGKPGTRH
jgi:hypothetical protein